MVWLPFDLHPEYPPEGIPRTALIERYGQEMHDRLRTAFAAAGLVYNPPPEVVPNSRAALRLAELARDSGVYEPVHERLMDAYWGEGQNIGDHEVLRGLAAGVGLAGHEVDALLAGDAQLERVLTSTTQAQSIGVSGIPAWLLERRLLVLGAQPREVFERAFAQVEAN